MLLTSEDFSVNIYEGLLHNKIGYFEGFNKGNWIDWMSRGLMGIDTASIPGSSSSSDAPFAIFYSLFKQVNNQAQVQMVSAVGDLIDNMAVPVDEKWIGRPGKWLLILAAGIAMNDPSITRSVYRMAARHEFVFRGFTSGESYFNKRDIHYYLLAFLSEVDLGVAYNVSQVDFKRFWTDELHYEPQQYGRIAILGLAKIAPDEALKLVPEIVSKMDFPTKSRQEDMMEEFASICRIVLREQSPGTISNTVSKTIHLGIPGELEVVLRREERYALQYSIS